MNQAIHKRTQFLNGLEKGVKESLEDFSNLSVQELANKYSLNSDSEERDRITQYVGNNPDRKYRDAFIVLIQNPDLVSANEVGEDLGDHEYNY
jgi:hypothetical protein